MDTPVEGGRGVRLRVFGIDVHVDLSFVLIMGFLGYYGGAKTPRDLAIWLVVAAAAVLVHELGHAVMARTTGAKPVIALTGFGGVTMYNPPRPLTRVRSLAITLAGPFAGLAVGGVIFYAQRRWSADLRPGGVAFKALEFASFTTIGWSVLNLLPVLPLDGGQALRELLPGTPEIRARRAAMVSVVLLIPLFALALWAKAVFIAVFLLLFGVNNLQAVLNRSGGPNRSGAVGEAAASPAGSRGPAPEQAVVGLLWQGAPAQARTVLESLPPGTPIDLAVHGAVLAATDQPYQGQALLMQELARRPADSNVVALLVLAHGLRHDWEAVAADLRSNYAQRVPLAVVERVIQEATMSGRADIAAQLSELPRTEPR